MLVTTGGYGSSLPMGDISSHHQALADVVRHAPGSTCSAWREPEAVASLQEANRVLFRPLETWGKRAKIGVYRRKGGQHIFLDFLIQHICFNIFFWIFWFNIYVSTYFFGFSDSTYMFQHIFFGFSDFQQHECESQMKSVAKKVAIIFFQNTCFKLNPR